METPKFTITSEHTITEALEILKQQVDHHTQSEEAKKFHQDNPSWSTLFRESYKPYQDALHQYEEALKVNEWLNGKNPENGNLTIGEIFFRMSDQQRLSLFHRRINSSTSSIFDEHLQAWWLCRY